MKKILLFMSCSLMSLVLLGCGENTQTEKTLKLSNQQLAVAERSYAAGFDDWGVPDLEESSSFDISGYQFNVQEALSSAPKQIQETTLNKIKNKLQSLWDTYSPTNFGKTVPLDASKDIKMIAIQAFLQNPLSFVQGQQQHFENLNVSNLNWCLDGKVWQSGKWIPLSEYAKDPKLSENALTSPMFLIDSWVLDKQIEQASAKLSSITQKSADATQGTVFSFVGQAMKELGDRFDASIRGTEKNAFSHFSDKYIELLSKKRVISDSFLSGELNNDIQNLSILKNVVDSGQIGTQFYTASKTSELLKLKTNFERDEKNIPQKNTSTKTDLTKEEKAVIQDQDVLVSILQKVSKDSNSSVWNWRNAGYLQGVVSPSSVCLRARSADFAELVNKFFKENLYAKDLKKSLFFKYAITNRDTIEQKAQKRALLQKEFELAVSSAIDLVVLNTENKGVVIGSALELLPKMTLSSMFDTISENFDSGIEMVIPKIFDLNKNLNVFLVKEDGTQDKIPNQLRKVLNAIIPQGSQSDINALLEIELPFDADKLDAFLKGQTKSKGWFGVSLASDTISTRESRANHGQVNLSQLTLEGNTGRTWTLDQALYVSVKGTVENKTTDNLNGVVSYNFNGFTLGSTYAFENSKELSKYSGSFLLAKSLSSSLFAEMQGGFEKEGASVLSTQKYTIGADLTFGSPFVQLDHVVGQGARGFVGCDFGSVSFTSEEGSIGISGLAKIDMLTGAPVISTGVNFVMNQGISLSSNLNMHSELSVDVSLDISK
jgi:hypothetical protein